MSQQLNIFLVGENGGNGHAFAIFAPFLVEEVQVEMVQVDVDVGVNVGERGVGHHGIIASIDILSDFVNAILGLVVAFFVSFQLRVIGDFLFQGAYAGNNIVRKWHERVKSFIVGIRHDTTVIIFFPFFVLEKFDGLLQTPFAVLVGSFLVFSHDFFVAELFSVDFDHVDCHKSVCC